MHKPKTWALAANGGHARVLVGLEAVAETGPPPALLETHRAKGDFARLAVFAAPVMLGLLRDAMTPGVRAAVVLERDSNLLHEAPKALRATVREALSPS